MANFVSIFNISLRESILCFHDFLLPQVTISLFAFCLYVGAIASKNPPARQSYPLLWRNKPKPEADIAYTERRHEELKDHDNTDKPVSTEDKRPYESHTDCHHTKDHRPPIPPMVYPIHMIPVPVYLDMNQQFYSTSHFTTNSLHHKPPSSDFFPNPYPSSYSTNPY